MPWELPRLGGSSLDPWESPRVLWVWGFLLESSHPNPTECTALAAFRINKCHLKNQ